MKRRESETSDFVRSQNATVFASDFLPSVYHPVLAGSLVAPMHGK